MRAELTPMSETEFYLEEVEGQIVFDRNEDGRFDSFILKVSDQEYSAERLDTSGFTDELRKEYVGEYYSEELGTSYAFIEKDDGIVATHRRHGDIPMIYIGDDRFISETWFFGRVLFQRGDGKNVEGFLLTGGRVRNMRFDKK